MFYAFLDIMTILRLLTLLQNLGTSYLNANFYSILATIENGTHPSDANAIQIVSRSICLHVRLHRCGKTTPRRFACVGRMIIFGVRHSTIKKNQGIRPLKSLST